MVLAVVGFLPQSYNGFSCVCSTINIELQIVQKFLQAIEQKKSLRACEIKISINLLKLRFALKNPFRKLLTLNGDFLVLI